MTTDSAHPLGPRFESALAFALEHHRDDRRKGTQIPYAAHLLAVASIVLEMESSEDEAVAALLHDVIEDGGGPEAEAEIRAQFGGDVARMVRANSDSTTQPKPPWRRRKEAYIAQIPGKAPDELRVSIADKLHNARSILADHRRYGDAVFNRFAGRRDGTLWYYRSLLGAFEARRGVIGEGGGQALDELRQVVAELERRAGPGERD
ncbi:MAG TPA: HD domain-containing protein [Solirubrobacterales bacterium]|nr:HD domain-containing protein [Solirubrobacterales bacterium]